MDKKDWAKIMQALGMFLQVGLMILITGGGGFFAGHFVDNLLGTGIFFKLIGFLLGTVSGFLGIYRLINDILLDNNDENRKNDK